MSKEKRKIEKVTTRKGWLKWFARKGIDINSTMSYCENIKRLMTWAEQIECNLDPTYFDKLVAEVGSIAWHFKKGVNAMNLFKVIERMKKIKDMKGWYKFFEETDQNPKEKLMYDENLMRDITREEWAAYQCNAKSYTNELKKAAPERKKLDKKLVLAIVDWMEATPTKQQKPIPSKEGYYEGLWDVVDEHGLDMADVDLKHIQEAFRIYRQIHPLPPPKPLDDLVSIHNKTRDKLFGFTITSVIRTMGKEGFDFGMVRRALKALGAEASKNTIKAQLRYAKIDFKEPAPLTSDQIDKLWQVS